MLHLPMGFKATRYVGLNQVNDSVRYAYEFGPTLLAAVPRSALSWNNATNCLDMPSQVNPMTPSAWLRNVHGKPLHFTTLDETVEFMPYFEVNDQLMTVYPCYPVHTSK